jgi:L-lactate dehydrogenase complex protein LldG
MTETGSRADFLATVRRAVATPHGHETRPVAPLPNPLPPVVYATAPGDDLVGAFTRALTALGGVVREVSTADARTALVEEAIALARHGDQPVRVVITAEPECAPVAALLAGRDDVEILDYDNPQTVATADLGITGARAGVALTGSIVVDATRAGGRTVSLLPATHLALLARDAIVATPGESWRAMAEPMPSNVVQITGPSRSADIELIITLGVHGPRALMVGDLDTFAESPEADM